MTKIRFYTDVSDVHALVLRLVHQGYAKQRKVTIYVPDREQAMAFSDRLWSHTAEGFVPNVLADAEHAGLTPVHLAWQAEHIHQDDILLNCQASLPKFFSRFRHVFELIGRDEADKAAGRQRWAFYRDRGYEIQHMQQQTQS